MQISLLPVLNPPRITYYKRFRMEVDLECLTPPPGPSGYTFVPWDDALQELHAEVKYLCFAEELDAAVFPSLATRQGCSRLMNEIRRKPGFLPDATWLVATPHGGYCGTVQGVRERTGVGAIQNLGVTPFHRGRGLGTALLLRALAGFRRAGLGRAFLEVTARNDGAVQLYHRLGFRRRKTIYKAVEAIP